MCWNFGDVGLLHCIRTRKHNDMEICGTGLPYCSINNCCGDMLCINRPLICIATDHSLCYFLIQVPETPMWLLSKDRPDEALKSLQWLRGWVPAKNVEKEFAEMQRYNVYSSSCGSCQKTKSVCEHPPPTLLQKLNELTRKRNLKPFILLLVCFAFSNFVGLG